MNVRAVAETLGQLSLMQFFPADENARAAILSIVCDMAENEQQVEWLVKRMLNLYQEWPGPREMRACFCSKFKPRDGINAFSGMNYFPDGIPSEKPARDPLALPAGLQKQLPDGHIASADAEFDLKIRLLAEAKDISRLPRKPAPTPTNPDYKPIGPVEIARAVQELHEKRARQELFGNAEENQ